MKYTKFIIRNYKAINELVVNVGNNIIPIIGINESGKTTILNAILAFDKSKDNILDGFHANPKNRYLTKQPDCELIACIKFEGKSEYEEIGKSLKISMDDVLYSWLSEKYESGESLQLKRDFEDGELQNTYSIMDECEAIVQHPKSKHLAALLYKKLPNILYFDDFSDRVPEQVAFPKSYSTDGKLSNGKIREWQEIIQEIFARALDEDVSLKDFLNLEDADDKQNYLSDVTQTLNNEIISEWQRLKKTYSELQPEDGNSSLSLKVDYSNTTDGPVFKFKVVDNERDQRNRVFDIGTRSKGFQWFFNFIIKLRFNPKYKEFPQNAIFLLDEPGSYLHSSAQAGLLKVLKEIAAQNTILYCTHSQYLLDPDIINVGSIKIASKDEGVVNLEDYGNCNVSRSMGAFSALNHALQLKYGFVGGMLDNCILTEGITDYYFFKMFLPDEGIHYLPGAGCGNLKEMISILIAGDKRFLILLDNDGEGRRARAMYETYFQKSFLNNVFQYEGIGKKDTDFMLENIISPEDIQRMKDFTSCKDIKKAICELYFLDNRADYIGEINETTRRNIDIIARKFKAHFEN